MAIQQKRRTGDLDLQSLNLRLFIFIISLISSRFIQASDFLLHVGRCVTSACINASAINESV